jgi:hypothetical protein
MEVPPPQKKKKNEETLHHTLWVIFHQPIKSCSLRCASYIDMQLENFGFHTFFVVISSEQCSRVVKKRESVISTAATMRVLNIIKHWVSKHQQVMQTFVDHL